jgi:hypothetical protein
VTDSEAVTEGDPRIFCITGMHCSGTSAIARIVNLLGVDLGPPEVGAPARRSNTKGLWEYPELTRVSERILRAFGGSWAEPPELPTGWQRSPELDRYRAAARKVIDASFAESERWGWKDPRCSMLAPFWEELLGPLRWVICVRHPADVVESLRRRDGFEPERSVALWLRYMRDLLAFVADRPHVIVCFDDLWSADREPLQLLAAFVGEPETAATAEFQAAVTDWLDEALWHHRAGAAVDRNEREISPEAVELYRALRSAYE